MVWILNCMILSNFLDSSKNLNYRFSIKKIYICSNANQLIYKCILEHILLWNFLLCVYERQVIYCSLSSVNVLGTTESVSVWACGGCLFKKHKASSIYSWFTPKKFYISPLPFDLKSPFGSSEKIFIFMGLLKVDFPTTYNLMKRFMTSVFRKFPKKVPIALVAP